MKLGILIISLWGLLTGGMAQELSFTYQEIDQAIGHRAVGDINKDGLNDILALNEGQNGSTLVVCYLAPQWKKIILLDMAKYTDFPAYRACDMELFDLDKDGDLDLIGHIGLPKNDKDGVACWFENPGRPGDWIRHDLGPTYYAKDLEIADFNRDGRPDIAYRTVQHLIHIFLQGKKGTWQEKRIEITAHDGLAAADIDGDGDPDLALNGYWLETPKNVVKGAFIRHVFDEKWFTQKTGEKGIWYDNNSRVSSADINQDGGNDIIIAQSENKGYPVSWYEAPKDPRTGQWVEHVIGQINYCHSLNIADFDLDGDPDIMAAEMPRYEEFSPVVVFLNQGKGKTWQPLQLSTKGNYSAAMGDLDNDGDMDIVGLRSYNLAPIEIWRNNINKKK